jgi:hypothetical protein
MSTGKPVGMAARQVESRHRRQTLTSSNNDESVARCAESGAKQKTETATAGASGIS